MKKTLLALSVAGLGSLIANPASAQQVYASGSATIVLMNGASQSIGTEIGAPSGAIFNNAAAAVDVTPVLSGSLDVNTTMFTTLTVDPGDTTNAPAGTSFTAAAATVLGAAGPLDEVVSIIRAGAGVDGLD